MAGEQYDADYFLRGKQTGKSLYEDYRWLPELTIPMVKKIVNHLGVDKGYTFFEEERGETVLDFGCARGYVVKALRQLGYNAYGYDISKWAVDNADWSVREYLNPNGLFTNNFDWVIAKDVLEHVDDINGATTLLRGCARKGILVVVPLSHDGTKYDVPEYEMDVTHIHRHPIWWWVGHLHDVGWSVEARYRIPGIKDNYAQYPTGNGFITCRRLSD